MNIFGILIIFILILFLGPLIFSGGFHKWITRNLHALGLLLASIAPALFGVIAGLFKAIFGVMKIYSIILLITTLIALGLITISLFINSQALIVLAILLIIIAWLPAGLILRASRLTTRVIPGSLKTFIAWTAFVGFLGLMCPDVLTLKSFLGASLVGLIFFGVCVKMNILEKIVVPLIFIMCFWTAWNYFWPQSFRSTTRYVESWAKRTQSKKDRGSIRNETEAATTYAVTLRDVVALYKCSHDTVLTDVAIDTVKRGTIVKLVSRKKEIKVIDEQGFVEIQLANKKGLFVGGQNKYFVEAEFVQLATPSDITSKEDLQNLIKKHEVTNEKPKRETRLILNKGIHYFPLKAGEKSPLITVNGLYCAVSDKADQFSLFYPELKKDIPAWTSGYWPKINTFIIKSLVDQVVTITVL